MMRVSDCGRDLAVHKLRWGREKGKGDFVRSAQFNGWLYTELRGFCSESCLQIVA